jgi:uncharacterized protein (DUF1015 family)
MPELTPFCGLRYTGTHDLSALVAPPYDVVDDQERARLESRSEHNAVRVEMPRDDGEVDRYTNARRLLDGWRMTGAIALDDAPTLTAYRMSYTDEAGNARHTLGVLGALAIADGALLPHEHTTPKAKDDRLNLLRACKTNVSPIWGLAPAAGLSALLEPDGAPIGVATDDDAVRHEAWIISDPARIQAIAAHVAGSAVLVADGHHRYEVARAYREEQRAANGDQPGGYDAVLAYVVELDDAQLTVGAIHRLVAGLPAGFDLVGALEPFFIAEREAGADALAVVTPSGAWRLTPRDPDAHALDSSRVAEALATLPEHTLTYQHGKGTVIRAVEEGRADAAFLLRPATVEQIADTGRLGVRMPPKTTFFWPKPRTGIVFRPLTDE